MCQTVTISNSYNTYNGKFVVVVKMDCLALSTVGFGSNVCSPVRNGWRRETKKVQDLAEYAFRRSLAN